MRMWTLFVVHCSVHDRELGERPGSLASAFLPQSSINGLRNVPRWGWYFTDFRDSLSHMEVVPSRTGHAHLLKPGCLASILPIPFLQPLPCKDQCTVLGIWRGGHSPEDPWSREWGRQTPPPPPRGGSCPEHPRCCAHHPDTDTQRMGPASAMAPNPLDSD